MNKTLATLALCLAASLASAAAAPETPKTIHWLIAHDRDDSPFHDLMKGFAERLEKNSGGSLKIEFVPITAPDSKWGEIGRESVMKGESEMSQLASGSLNPETNVGVLDLPFLFRSYEHAEAFFDSPAGKKLLAGVQPSSGGKIRAFAYTYSGGFRVLAGKAPVEKVSDFKGLRMSATRGGAVMTALEAELGAVPAAGTNVAEDFAKNLIDLDETEINRYAIARRKQHDQFKDLSVLNLTRHRMYTTAIIVNEAFFEGLSKHQQEVLTREVERVAKDERRTSIQLEGQNLALLKKDGVRVYEMPAAERALFAKAGEAVVRKYPQYAPLVKEIRAMKDERIEGLTAR